MAVFGWSDAWRWVLNVHAWTDLVDLLYLRVLVDQPFGNINSVLRLYPPLVAIHLLPNPTILSLTDQIQKVLALLFLIGLLIQIVSRNLVFWRPTVVGVKHGFLVVQLVYHLTVRVGLHVIRSL